MNTCRHILEKKTVDQTGMVLVWCHSCEKEFKFSAEMWQLFKKENDASEGKSDRDSSRSN
jgi:hypothetical protein